MSNPLLNSFAQLNGLGSVMKAFKNGSNPTMLIHQMAQQNPQLQPIVQALDQGMNPQQLFYNLCQQKGVDPNAVLSQLK